MAIDPEPIDPNPDPALTEAIRLAIYAHFATTGRAPAPETLAQQTGSSMADTRHALTRLHHSRDLVLTPADPDQIAMAHPFSAVPLGFSVMGEHILWWGGCAWDSFAIPHLLRDEPDVLVATRCPACDTPHAWVVNRDAPPSGDQVAHFLTPVAQIWDDVVHACAHQRLFCSRNCVRTWLSATNNREGYVMDLPTLWRLAQHWYAGRLDHGYQRRDPSSATAYFAEVGLTGPFWNPPHPH